MRAQRGYTLIEVIVAFALLALAMTLLLGSLSGAARQVGRAEGLTRASLHAQSLLAQVGVGEALREGRSQGEFDNGRFHWNLQIAPYADPQNSPVAEAPAELRLLQLDLSMRWGEAVDQQLHWRTLRLAPVVAAGMDSP